jgi:UDP-4-amino-4,6-dideoxy-N-acetyl-beta-L-altrosamine transaminase
MTESSIPYSRQNIDADDIAAIMEVLQSPWLTTGPAVERFEAAIAEYEGARTAVAFSSGTAALHGMLQALDLGPGDEVIVPAMTFVATGNAVLYQGATPVFADVQAETLLLDPVDVQRKITPQTKAILAVDYAGQPCDYVALRQIAQRHNLYLLADASHAVGARWHGRSIAQWSDMAVYSFHPVKPITTAEGGMVTTENSLWAERLRRFRGHGIDSDFRQRAARKDWRYQQVGLGFNYRLSDLHAALGISQLKKLPTWMQQRTEVATLYRQALRDVSHWIRPLTQRPGVEHAHHLFVIRWQAPTPHASRDWLFARLRAAGIGVNVHYQPIYQHPYYQQAVPTARNAKCPQAERAIHEILSLPIYPGMTNHDVDRVSAVLLDSIRLSSIAHAA